MLNVYGNRIPPNGKDSHQLYGAQDFISRLSAFDDAFSHTLGITMRRQTLTSEDSKTKWNKFSKEQIPTIFNDGPRQKVKPREKTRDITTKHPKRPVKGDRNLEPQALNSNEFVLRLYSKSVPQYLDSQDIEMQYKASTRRRRLRSHNFTTDYTSQSKCPTKHSEMRILFQKSPLSIELHEVPDQLDTIAIGLPNVRSLSVIPPKPRFMQAEQYFFRLKKGLKDWVDLQSTKLQQAELIQNVKEAAEVIQYLNRVQRRLNTISQLEEEYHRYRKLYRHIRAANVENGALSEEGTNLLFTRDLSKSAQVVAKVDMPKKPEGVQDGLDSSFPDNLTRQSWFSSMMNLIRTKSNRRLYSPTNQPVPSPHLDKNVIMRDSSFSDLCGQEFRQKIITPPRNRRSRAVYKKSRGDSLLHSLKRQEEFIKKQMCDIEAQIECLSGTMKCEVIGVSGPNYNPSKDEFRVSLRQGTPTLPSLYELDGVKNSLLPLHKTAFTMGYSEITDDKWSLHGRVESGSNFFWKRENSIELIVGGGHCYKFPKQNWDHPGHIFSPTIHGVFTLKVTEFKKFGKDEVLLHQAFDFTGLFNSKCYLLSTPLRNQGQVRFNFQLRWCPLADTDNERLIYYTSPSMQLSDTIPQNKQKSNNLRHLTDTSDSLASSKLDSTGAAGKEARLDTFIYDGPTSVLTTSSSSASPSNASQPNLGSISYVQRQNLTKSVLRSVKITGINDIYPELKRGTNQRTASIKNWLSMPNLELNPSQNHYPRDNERARLSCIDEQNLDENCPSDLDIKVRPIQSIYVKIDNFNGTHLKPRKSNNARECLLTDMLLLVQRKLSQSMHGGSAFRNIFQQLVSSLERLSEILENRRSASMGFQSPSNLGAHAAVKYNMPIESGGFPRKQDTLSSLWKSFAFLQDFSDSRDDLENSRSSRSFIPNASPESGVILSRAEQLTTGWKQLDLATVWHLDYMNRLIDRLTQREIPLEQQKSVIRERLVYPPMLFPEHNTIDLMETSVTSHWMSIALMGQIYVMKRTLDLVEDLITNPQAAPLQYVTNLVGGNDGLRKTVYRQCIYPLIWKDISGDLQSGNGWISRPLIMLDVRQLKKLLLKYYAKSVATFWPNVDGTKVIDVFLSDLLDVYVNGENVFTVPLTQLEQRLQLSSQQSANVRYSMDGSTYGSAPMLNDRLREVFMYLAGQCYIQQKLRGSEARDILPSLLKMNWSFREVFDVHCLDYYPKEVNVDLSYANGSPTEEPDSLSVIANHSTKTWLEVAHLASSSDYELAGCAIEVLLLCDRQITTLCGSLQTKLEYLQSQDLLAYTNKCLPVLFSNGPPIFCYLSLIIASRCNGQKMEFITPLWMSMLRGYEMSFRHNKQRFEILRALAVLYEQQYTHLKTQSKQLHQLNSKPFHIMNSATSVNAVSRLLTRLSTSDSDEDIRLFTKQLLQKIGGHVQIKPQNLKAISIRRPVRMIWTPMYTDRQQQQRDGDKNVWE